MAIKLDMTDVELIELVRSAYRLGALDVMLDEDVIAAIKPPGLIKQSFKGERELRLDELEIAGLSVETINDLRLERAKEGS